MKNQLLICLSCFLSVYLLQGQGNWLRKAGGTGHDEALDMCLTGTSQYYVTGYFNVTATFDNVNLNSAGLSDVFVQKMNADGTTQWAVKAGGAGPDRAVAVASDEAGNAYITGYFTGTATFGNFTLTGQPDFLEVFIAKLSPAGTFLWAVSCGGPSDDYSFGVTADATGNVLVTGQYRGQATFGPFGLASDFYEGTNQPSLDVFTAKLDGNGNWLWVKGGHSQGDNRGLAVVAAPNGDVYVTGQFSDTVTFGQVHNNSVVNAGFLIKYSSTGDELWFARLAAAQVMCNDLAVDGEGNIVLTGDYIGQLTVFAGTVEVIPYVYFYNLMVLKFSPEGVLQWKSSVGSSSEVSAKAVAIGTQNEIYVAGTFKCRFDEFSLIYGEGIFNSAGFRDVFVARWSPAGERLWERQFGGPQDDYCASVATGQSVDKPLVAGSFSKFFNVPSTYLFSYNTQNNMSNGLKSPSCGVSMCGDNSYSGFISVHTQINKDIFLSSPVDISRQPYDFYNRSHMADPPCDRPVVEPCAGLSYGNQFCSSTEIFCRDTVIICGWQGGLYPNENTGTPNFIGPKYTYLWNDLDTARIYTVYNNGWNWVEVNREDQCWGFSDSVYVIMSTPVCPLITDDQGINNAYCNTIDIELCYPDTVILTGTPINSEQFYWTPENNSTILSDDSLMVTGSGDFQFNQVDQYNCVWKNFVEVNVNVPLDTISPLLKLKFQGQWIAPYDTVYRCENDNSSLGFQLVNLLGGSENIFHQNTKANWQLYFNGSLVQSCDTCSWNFNYYFTQEGWVEVHCEPMLIPPYPCSGFEAYPEQIFHVYVKILPALNINAWVEGPSYMCLGDTVMLVAHGAQTYTWNSFQPIQYVSPDTILVVNPGQYHLHGVSWLGECDSHSNFTKHVNLYPNPIVTMWPAHGIVCPGDSLLLTCEAGLNYQWIGPSGELLDTTQTMWVTIPGLYHCVQTNFQGCVRESNFVEAKEYNSPYLLANPGTDLCVNGTVIISLLTNNFSQIQWAPPLSGNSMVQFISQPGQYSVSVSFCGISEVLSINITSSYTPADITPSSVVICPGGQVTLTANSGMQGYLWQPGMAPSTQITVSDPGVYYLTTFDEWGCMGTDQVELFAYDMVHPLTSDLTGCVGETVTLVAESALPVFWSASPNGSNPLGNNFELQVTVENSPMTYYVFSVDSTCSSAPVAAVVNVYASSLPPVISWNDDFCNGGPLWLTTNATPGMQVTWTLPDQSQPAIQTLLIDPAEDDDEGIYSAYFSDVNCTGPPAQVFVDVPAPQVLDIEFDGDTVLCEGDILHLASPVGAVEYNWVIQGDTIPGDYVWSSWSVSLHDEGFYSLMVEGADCNYLFNQIFIDVVEMPQFVLDETTVYCDGGWYTATLPGGYDQYLWSSGDTTSQIIVPETGWLWAQITNLPDCSVIDSMWVESIDCFAAFINVLTPNDDGLNDIVDFRMLRIPIDEVRIYNRWGKLVRHLRTDPFIWRGDNDQYELLSAGNYLYVLSSPSPRFHELSGNIQILRKE